MERAMWAAAFLMVLAAVALGDAGNRQHPGASRTRPEPLGKGGDRGVLLFPLPAVAAMREARRSRLILRGGFDVWGDDGDAPAESTAKQGLKEVREAAREAAAKARSFKPVSVSGAGRDAASKDGAGGALGRRGKPLGGAEKKKKSSGGGWLDVGKPLDVSDSEEEEEEEEEAVAAAPSTVHKAGATGTGRAAATAAAAAVAPPKMSGDADAGGKSDDEDDDESSSSSSSSSSSGSGNRCNSNDRFEQEVMQMGSDEFDFDDGDEEEDGAIHRKDGAQGDAGLPGSVPGLSALDQEALLDDDYEGGEDEDGSEEFQPNPKWLLPEYRPAGWAECDANNAKRSSTDADVAEVMAGSLGAGKGASSSKRSKGGGKGADASLAEGMSKMTVKGKKKGGKDGKEKDALANLIPIHKIALPAPGARCNMDGSTDPYYRYTMPGVNVKVEGATKMIKSVILNIDELAQAVGRPPEYIVTYFGQECSSMATIDTKFGIEGRAWVSGKHEQGDLQRLVFRFVRDCCLCRKCAGPETAVVVEGKKKRKIVSLECKSCGARTQMEQSARFTKWISSRPPSEAMAAWGQVDSGMGGKSLDEGEPRGGIATTTGGGSAAAAAEKHSKATREAGKGEGGQGDGEGTGNGGNASAADANTVEELKEWRDEQAKRLKKLLRAGTISQEEYEVQKMNAKDIYRNRKLSIEGTEAADGDDDQGMTFTTGINANML